jgi:hypothetical protein
VMLAHSASSGSSGGGGLSDDAAATAIGDMLRTLLPPIHAYFSGNRHRDDVQEAIVTLESVMHFATEQLRRRPEAN